MPLNMKVLWLDISETYELPLDMPGRLIFRIRSIKMFKENKFCFFFFTKTQKIIGKKEKQQNLRKVSLTAYHYHYLTRDFSVTKKKL